MDPVVEAEAETVDETVADPAAETGHEDFADVCDAIAVGVLEEEDVGGGGDEDSAAPGGDGSGIAEVGGEHGGVVDLSVAVAIFE